MDSKFNVVYTGLKDGVSAEEFTNSFCNKFGISEEKAQQILSSSSDVVVKKELDEAKAKKYAAAFGACGMLIKLDEIVIEPNGLSLEPIDDAAAETNSPPTECPKCASDQIEGDECKACGIYISKYLENQENNPVQIDTDTDLAQDTSDTEQNNPYATPEAPLDKNIVSKEGQGSLEGGINGDYDFTIGEILSEAWARTKGVKGSFLLAWFFYIIVAVVINMAFTFIGPDPELLMNQGRMSEGMIWSIAPSLITIPILYPILAGIVLMGIHRSVDADINATSVFGHYKMIVPLTLLTIVTGILIMLGFLLLIIPGLYLSVAYMMAMSLMIDRNMGFWSAMETSRKAVSRHWFKVFFLYLLMGLLMMLASLPMFIGLIWVLPLMSIGHGVLYKYMFGVESVD